jgi:predicted MFS family arabinose efflux permease
MENEAQQGKKIFSRYEVFVIAVLAILQFTIVLDFMVLSPLGAQLMDELSITTAQFGWVVSAYAFSAGISGMLTAGFADKFDRKKLLLFFYTGFIGGTLLCALAPDYHSLLVARIVTGLFGGVIGSVSFAIITDIFRLEVRGRVMGFVQMAFASTQVMGIPIGIFLANRLGWHSPFFMIVGLSVLVGIAIVIHFRPIDAHLKIKSERSPFQHLVKTVSHPMYARAFAATTLLATGGYMMMPFGSAFGIHNLGISFDDLPMLYLITGICSMITGPFIGKLSDTLGKYPIFVAGSFLSMLMVVIYTNLGLTPLWLVVFMNVIMFVGISSRIISSSALMTAVPEPMDRGAFMSINASVQQISGGIASVIAGMIVVSADTGELLHYDTLGYVVVGAMIITVTMMYFINEQVMRKSPVISGAK